MSNEDIENTRSTGNKKPGAKQAKVIKSEAQWRDELEPESFHVCREKGTERAFTGKYWDMKEQGTYHCIACGEPLFLSETKYDSGCGWPSFFQPASPERVEEHADRSHGMMRTEVVCSRCDSHLGHVFPDGPPETGLRYCINSASLQFEKNQKK